MSKTDELPTTFINIPPDAFPVTTVIVDKGLEDVLFMATADEPGAFRIPAIGRPVDVLLLFGDGKCLHSGMPDERVARLKELVAEVGDV
jgi:hypothetical protein